MIQFALRAIALMGMVVGGYIAAVWLYCRLKFKRHRKLYSGSELEDILCKAVGLDPNSVAKLTLELDCTEPAKLTVVSYVTDKADIDYLQKRLAEYVLHERAK